MGSKSKQKTTSNQTTTAAPPSWTMPGISDAAARVTAALQQLPGTKYEGQFNALPDFGGAIDAYGRSATDSREMSDWTRGLVEDPRIDTRTGLLPAITAAIDPVQKQLLERTLPGIRSSALESGAYSGDRAMTMLPELAIRDANESMQRIAAEMGYRDLQANADRELGFMGMLPDLVDTIMRTSAGEGDLLKMAAGLGAEQDQAGINNDLARNQYEWMYPFQGLDIASNLLAQLSGGYGTTTSQGEQTVTQKTGGLGSIASGLLGAASLIGSFPTAGGGTFGGNFMSELFGKRPRT